MSFDLPILEILPALRQALNTHPNVVLQAPAGAGKSTVVPLELLEESWLRGRRLIMLEPRRLAARAVASRMAQTLGEPVGATVGYRMRLDSRVSGATRIEVVTEGVLASIVQRDAELNGIGAILFDEFHERSLQADLGLALCLDIQAVLRPELRLLVMSATLAAEAIATLLGDAAIVRSSGRVFTVDVRYEPYDPKRTHATRSVRDDGGAVARRAAAGAVRALGEQAGDVLVFLPGAAEIRRAGQLLEAQLQDTRVRVLPLLGELDLEAQERAIRPAVPGTRKVVLATNIAETSLTIEGIGAVVDSGLARRARFDPASGMSRLETVRVSHASAEQRCGRAGRLGPGICYRLWSEGAQESLEAATPAEILEADLAPLALELAAWNVSDPRQLKWLDPPAQAPYEQARGLLRDLEALDAEGRITSAGREMLELRVHPRLAHMLLRARELELDGEACDLAALLSERDILRRGSRRADADIRSRLEALYEAAPLDVDHPSLTRVRRVSAQLRQRLGNSTRRSPLRSVAETDAAGVLLAFAYPDRVALRRAGGEGRYLLSNGRGAHFMEAQPLARAEFLVIAALDDSEREARIFLAAPLSRAALEATLGEKTERIERIEWNERERAVLAVGERRLGALVIESTLLTEPDTERVTAALVAGIRSLSLEVLPWSTESRSWQARVEFVRALPSQVAAGWPDVSDQSLLATLETWLGPWLGGMTRIVHLEQLDLQSVFSAMLRHELQRRLGELAPTHISVPSGSRIRVDYLGEDRPSLSVRVQELFGLETTPCIGGGAVPVLIKLLSPAQRPVQVTRDLASFWDHGYAQVRKELKGRYPKHSWPENPRVAPAVRGVRRRQS